MQFCATHCIVLQLLTRNPDVELQVRQERQERAKQLEAAAGAARENTNNTSKKSS
jgi:hypothetical protein